MSQEIDLRSPIVANATYVGEPLEWKCITCGQRVREGEPLHLHLAGILKALEELCNKLGLKSEVS